MASRSRCSHGTTKKSGTSFSIINFALLVLYAILSLIIIFLMYTYNFLAFHHFNLIVAGILFLLFLFWLILIIRKRARFLSMITLIIANIILAITLFAFKQTVDFTAQMNKTASFSEVEMLVVVPKDSSIQFFCLL